MTLPREYQAIQYYTSVKDLYDKRFMYLVKIASKKVYDPALAQDAVHATIVKVMQYLQKHKDAKIRLPIVEIILRRECGRINRGYLSKDLSIKHSNYDELYEGTDILCRGD